MQEWPLRSHLELPAEPVSVRSARLHTRNALRTWRMGALTDTVELLVSEIVTNAVRASARMAHRQHETDQAQRTPGMRLWLSSDRRNVLIQVWDGDHHCPARRNAPPDAEAGRGLLFIEILSAQWGCYAPDGQQGKIVWAVVRPLTANRRPRPGGTNMLRLLHRRCPCGRLPIGSFATTARRCSVRYPLGKRSR